MSAKIYNSNQLYFKNLILKISHKKPNTLHKTRPQKTSTRRRCARHIVNGKNRFSLPHTHNDEKDLSLNVNSMCVEKLKIARKPLEKGAN